MKLVVFIAKLKVKHYLESVFSSQGKEYITMCLIARYVAMSGIKMKISMVLRDMHLLIKYGLKAKILETLNQVYRHLNHSPLRRVGRAQHRRLGLGAGGVSSLSRFAGHRPAGLYIWHSACGGCGSHCGD